MSTHPPTRTDRPEVIRPGRPGEAPDDGPAETSPSWRVLTAHATQLSAVGVGLFLLMKTYSVSRYSLTTASALLTAAPVSVILGTLTSYEYTLWPVLAIAAGLVAGRLWSRERLSVAFLVTSGLAVACALLSPPFYLLAAVAVILFACVVQGVLARSVAFARPDDPPSWLPSRYTAVRTVFVVVTLGALTLSLPNAWLPAEIVVFRGADDARRVVVGHVLSADGGWVTILRGGDRGLTRLPADHVTARRVCHLGGAQPRPLRPLVLVVTGQPYESPNEGCRPLLAQLREACLIPGSFPTSHPYTGRALPQSVCRRIDVG